MWLGNIHLLSQYMEDCSKKIKISMDASSNIYNILGQAVLKPVPSLKKNKAATTPPQICRIRKRHLETTTKISYIFQKYV